MQRNNRGVDRAIFLARRTTAIEDVDLVDIEERVASLQRADDVAEDRAALLADREVSLDRSGQPVHLETG